VNGDTLSVAPVNGAGDIKHQYQRLVEIQREIVEMARRNAEIEGDCRTLRTALIREADRRRRRALLRRGPVAAGRDFLRRLAGSSDKNLEPGWSFQRPPTDSTSHRDRAVEMVNSSGCEPSLTAPP
jgi:hypothetical protein